MIELVEIHDLNDPLLLPWLDLYETAFPPGERLLVSNILGVLRLNAQGNTGSHLIAVQAASEAAGTGGEPGAPGEAGPLPALAGILFYYEPEDLEAALLGYFAVDPGMRGRGIGARIYHCLIERLAPRFRTLIFDVEDPNEMTTPEAAALAERRIGFYRRQGARLLGGIKYLQTVGWHQPPLRLRLMAHPIRETSPQQAFDLALALFGPQVLKQVGDLRWE